MHKDRILALADLIESMPHTSVTDDHGFNMDDFDHVCGTPACIAGWAIAMRANDLSVNVRSAVDAEFDSYSGLASDYLGLSSGVGSDLYYGPGRDVKLADITPAQAAATLRRLAETGKVEWGI